MRLTNTWTVGDQALKRAFGTSGEIGSSGEQLFKRQLDKRWIPYVHYEDDKAEQCAGIDFKVSGYTIDVKTNLHGAVAYIELGQGGWLFDPKKTSDIILHLDRESEHHCWYFRKEAQKAFRCAGPGKLPKSFIMSELAFVRLNIFNFI